MVGIGDSHSYAAIGLFHLPLLDDLIHCLQRYGILGAQYQPAGVAVDAIAQCRRKAVFLCWVIFALLVQVFLHPSDQRIRGAAFILMYHQPGGLISDKDILILIDDRKRVPSPQKGLICPLFLKNSSLRYRLTTSPTASLALISARLPFTLIRLVRIPLYIIEEGSSGTALPRNLSSRCPASFCPIVNSFIYDSFFYARRLAKMSPGCVSPLTGTSPIPSGASLPAGLPCRLLIFRPPAVCSFFKIQYKHTRISAHRQAPPPFTFCGGNGKIGTEFCRKGRGAHGQ